MQVLDYWKLIAILLYFSMVFNFKWLCLTIVHLKAFLSGGSRNFITRARFPGWVEFLGVERLFWCPLTYSLFFVVRVENENKMHFFTTINVCTCVKIYNNERKKTPTNKKRGGGGGGVAPVLASVLIFIIIFIHSVYVYDPQRLKFTF